MFKPSSPFTTGRRAQRGIALVFVLLMMVIAITAALFAARMTLLGDKASRNDRDRQIAFQAAELALNDAELDIMDVNIAKAAGGKGRGCKFGNPAAAFYPDAGCSADTDRRGFCQAPTDGKLLYKQIDWKKDSDDTVRQYVKYGEFTGRSGQLTIDGGVPTPKRPPKYIIVQSSPGKLQVLRGKQTAQIEAAYKVYALGYGVNENTKVMLEAEIYKPVLEKTCSGS